MKLDVRTIMFVIILGSMVMSAGLFSVSRGYLGQMRGVSRWALATLIQTAGWIIVGALRGVLPDVISIVIGNGLIQLALAMYLIIVADFSDKPLRPILPYSVVLLSCALLWYFSAITENLNARNIIVSISTAVLTLKSVHILAAPRASRLASHTFTLSLFALCGGFMTLRAGFYALVNPHPDQAAFASNIVNEVSYMIFYIFAIMLTFGFVLMCNERYIFQQKKAEEELKTNHQLITKLLAQVPGAIYQFRLFPDGHVSFPFASPGIQNIYEVTPEQVRDDAQLVFTRLHPDDAEEIVASIEVSARSMQPWQLEYRVLLPEQGLRWRLGQALPERLADGSILWHGFITDITDRKRVDQIKSEFISVVSHELRTPLTSIKGSLGLLEGGAAGELPSKALLLIKIAHKNSLRLVNLVKDILDMEKLASGKMNMNFQSLDLVDLARQAIEASASYAENFKVRYQLGQHPEQAFVTGDVDRLMQVFANLLSNAAKFSPSGAVVELRILPQPDQFLVEIEDHGSGIPLAFREHIFGKFAQADSTATRQLEGAGLGLNITKALVENMHGEIGFRSEENIATVFWFTLPLGQKHT